MGDIIISFDYMNKPKKYNKKRFEERTVRIFIHGFLHLLGYNHIKKKDYEIMFNTEKKNF